MIPELFRIGSFSVSPFGLMLVLSFLAAYWQLRRGMERLQVGTEDDASAIVLAGGIGGILGAKAYYALLYQDWRLLFSRSGLVWYGGFLLATAAIIWVMRRRKLPPWAMLDAATVSLALGYGIGRVGCFLVGDDYGVPTDLPWAVAFPKGLPPTTAENLHYSFGVEIPAGVAPSSLMEVHPTQLYETLLALVIWQVGRRWLGKYRPGTTALLVLGALACERFLVEFLRAKDDRLLGTFTVAQGISVGVLVILLVVSRYRPVAARASGPKSAKESRT